MEIPSSLDEFRLWKVDRLKQFLRERNLKVGGRKDELVALAYAAVQLNIPQVSDVRQEKATDYLSILRLANCVLPDPLSDLPDGWEGESSVRKWPPCMIFDIAKYLTNIDNVELGKRLMTDYKDGKSYSYLESGWLGEIYYHSINEQNKYCFLKSQCRPSQRVNNIPWKAWICLEKSTGEIIRGYCSCFAGLGSSCNHIGAMLFKVDLAWRTGMTQQSVTGQSCSWNRYGAKKAVEPKMVSELNWSKPLFSKLGDQDPINPMERQLFNPSHNQKRATTLEDLTNVLMPVCPNACFLQCTSINKPSETPNCPVEHYLNVMFTEEVTTSADIPPSIAELAGKYESHEMFIAALPHYSAEQVAQIELRTRGQANNPEWLAQRKGRLTASKIYDVVTRVRTIRSTEAEVDTTGLVRRISGISAPPADLPSLKYGRTMEEPARRRYVKLAREFGHPTTQVTQCGLFVHPDNVYLGATPDGIVCCKCCGTGLLEIKCPLSVAGEAPSTQNLAYLHEEGGMTKLKRNHKYYFQVQMQLGVAQKQWCDFFVFSGGGHILDRIVFDKEVWEEIVSCSEYFFKSVYANHLVQG